MHNKSGLIFAQQIQIINFEDLEVLSRPKKGARNKKFTTLSKKVKRNAKKSLDGGNLQQRSKKRAVEILVPVVGIKRTAVEAKKKPKDTTQSSNTESEPLVHSGIGDRLRVKPQFGNIKLYPSVGIVSQS